MFKRMFTMMVVAMTMVIALAIPANAAVQSEEGRPDIIGAEHFDGLLDLIELWNEDEEAVEIQYEVEMLKVGDYWIVGLTGYDGENADYMACGVYDHVPNDEEMDVLWANRMLEDEFDTLCEKYGFE